MIDHGFLGRLPRSVAEEILATSPRVHYPTGSVSFSEPDGARLAIVASGIVRTFMSTGDGRQITIRYAGPGELVGQLNTNGDGIATTVQALEPSTLVHLDLARMDAIVRRHPEVSLVMIEELAERLRQAYRTLAARAFASVRARVARDLLERARVSGRLAAGAGIPVTQQALADATGSVREVVARAVSELRRTGAIATRHNSITILDVETLAGEADYA